MILIPETGRMAVAIEPPATEEPKADMGIVAAILAIAISGVARGGLAADLAKNCEELAARTPGMALEYRRAAEMLRQEAAFRAKVCAQEDERSRSRAEGA